MKTTSKVLVLMLCLLLVSVPFAVAQIDYCEGNFDYDQNVDGSDAFIFKTDFGRSILGYPCPLDGPAPVSQTGQTVNFWGNDDGFYECGVKPVDQRFTTNCDSTFTDHLTGLMWSITYEIFSTYTWIDAMLAIDDYNTNELAGYNDWRMPNINELQSLIDYGQYSPAMAPNLYAEWDGEPVWSSTTRSNDWHYKYAVNFEDGTTGLAHYETIYSVLPVRGGHCAEPQPKIECNSAINCDIGSFSCCCVFGLNDPDNYCHPDQVIDLCTANGGTSNCWPCTLTPRFTDNGNGTVTDNKSGLIWLHDAFCNVLNNNSSGSNFNDATSAVSNLVSGQCGLTDSSVSGDWRLATFKEWRSFVCADFTDPALCSTSGHEQWQEGDPFNNVMSSGYWSNESDFRESWYVNLSNGHTGDNPKESNLYVWPVRGGVPSRFTFNQNGTVTDNNSGLVWLLNARCFINMMDWNEAMSAAASLGNGQCGLTDGSNPGDWRLPTIAEWESFMCDQYTNPSVCDIEGTGQGQNKDPFFNVQSNLYWSSTAEDPSYVWGVDLYIGDAFYDLKTNLAYFWAVREP